MKELLWVTFELRPKEKGADSKVSKGKGSSSTENRGYKGSESEAQRLEGTCTFKEPEGTSAVGARAGGMRRRRGRQAPATQFLQVHSKESNFFLLQLYF